MFVSHVSSSSKIPARLRHPTARQATIFTEAAFYREGVPYQRQAFLTIIQTELKVFGALSCGGYFYWTLFMTDLYHPSDLKNKVPARAASTPKCIFNVNRNITVKADTLKHFWMQFMTHQFEICSQLDEISASLIKTNGNPLLWLHRLTAPDVQYVCWIYSRPVTGHLFAVRSLVFWLWAWSYDSSEVDGCNWKHRTAAVWRGFRSSWFILTIYAFLFFNTTIPRGSN